MLNLPEKISPDPIAEALCEIRFTSLESDDVPEVVLSRFMQNPSWKSYKVVRLPISDIPAPIRRQDPNLKHQASLELRAPDASCVVKIGANVASFHRLAPYPGWARFKIELADFTNFTFSALNNFICTRVGFRYINTVSKVKHGVDGVNDFNLSVLIAGGYLNGPINLNYIITPSDRLEALIRIASPSFVKSTNITELSALVDIDVYTKEEMNFSQSADVIEWIDSAHIQLKRQFFSLFTEKMLSRLTGENNA